VHAGLFGDDLDTVASRLNEAVAARDTDRLRSAAADDAVIDPGSNEAQASDLGFREEPPDRIEPSTYALPDQTGGRVDLARCGVACR
jgi:hypothetical protein